MKISTSILALTLAVSTFFITSCKNGSQEENKTNDSAATSMNTTETAPVVAQASINLAIEGMSCENCANAIKTGLTSMAGVSACEVNLESKTAAVNFDNSKTTEDAIIAQVATLHDGKFKASKISELTACADTTVKKGDANCAKPCCKEKDAKSKSCSKEETKGCCKKDAKTCDHKEGEKK